MDLFANETTERPYIVSYRLQTFTVREGSKPGPGCRSSEDLARLAWTIFAELDADKEHFVVLCLNNKNRVRGYKLISTGSLTASLVHPREVYTAALNLTAAALCFVHNHPSGDPQPSPEDIEITKRLKDVGDLFGIRVLDHVILGRESYWSFADKGML